MLPGADVSFEDAIAIVPTSDVPYALRRWKL
jgi:hypothetical protein